MRCRAPLPLRLLPPFAAGELLNECAWRSNEALSWPQLLRRCPSPVHLYRLELLPCFAGAQRGRNWRGYCAAKAVGAYDPARSLQSRWAPYVQDHGQGQGQLPSEAYRPRGKALLTGPAANRIYGDRR